MSEKLCVFCKNWDFNGGDPGYSELTPGYDASMRCAKRMWDHPAGKRKTPFYLYQISNAASFREIIRTAETCPYYADVLSTAEAGGDTSTRSKT